MRTQGAPGIILARARVLVKNVLLLCLGVWVLVTLTFLYVVLSGRDLDSVYTSGLPPGARKEAKRDLTLDQPSIVRVYGAYWTHFLTGGWGFSSIYYPRTVVEMLGQRLPRSLLLLGTALIAGLGLSRALSGLLRSQRPRAGLSLAARFGTLALATIPLPLVSLLFSYGFAYRLKWFPFGRVLDPLVWRNYPEADVNGVLAGVFVALSLGFLLGRTVFALLRKRCLRVPLSSWSWIAGTVAFGIGTALGLGITLREALPLGLDLLRHLALPWLTLALYAGTWHALLLRSDFFSVGARSGRGLGSWAIYGSLLLALLPAVETTYHWLGLGPLLGRALPAADFPLLQGISFTLIGLLLAGVLAVKTLQELRPAGDPAVSHPSGRTPATECSSQRFVRAAYKVGLVGLLAFMLVGAIHPLLLESVWDPKIYDPQQGTDSRLPAPAPPSLKHLLGTDRGGRDVLSGLMSWVRSTLFSAVPQGMGAALLGLGFGLIVRLSMRAERRRSFRWAAQGVTLAAYAPLAVPFWFVSLTAVLRWPLPFWSWWVLMALPWAFHVLRSRVGNSAISGGWARYAALLGAAVCYGTGAILLRPTLQIPRGISIEPRLLQDPFREGWLFWPEILVRWLLPFLTFSLGWALLLLLQAQELPYANSRSSSSKSWRTRRVMRLGV